MPKTNESVACPHCGCHYCPVKLTEQRNVRWRGKIINTTRRHRYCNHCGVRFVTVETWEDDDNMGFPLVKNPDPKKAPPFKRRNPYIPPPGDNGDA